MNKRKTRVVIAKVGLDGHDRGAKIVARHLMKAGMEVIYTGLRQTVDQVVTMAQRFRFEVIDITGGAPEMTPDIVDMILRLAPLTSRLMLRSNLTALAREKRADLIDLCKQNRVIIVASFPSLNEAQAESQRGKGVFQESIDVLRKLNSIGYGKPGSGLELNILGAHCSKKQKKHK